MDFSYRVPPGEHELDHLELSLAGVHQGANAAVAIATIAELRRQGWDISAAAIRQGLAQVRWPARIEVVSRHPTVVLDAAHNVASIEALVRVLDESFSASARLLVFATARDKDVRGMLRVLLPKFEDVIFTRYWNNPRAMPPADLHALAGEISSGHRYLCDDAAAAWKLATRLAAADHLICITGSFFIAAEMRAAMQETAESSLGSLQIPAG
jgi:dihydrofolate synthase/folylpolyglutamate synthase